MMVSNDSKRRLAAGDLSVLRPRVPIVEELGQLLAQAFVALAVVAENDSAFEQGMLQFLRQSTPKLGGSRAENEKVTVGVGNRLPGGCAHGPALPTPRPALLFAHVRERAFPVQVPGFSLA
jgi:hypothetical protein